LTRILRYRDNWRLREEALNRIGKINKPDNTLVLQVLDIIIDENLYYEVRILACETMMEFLKNGANTFETEVKKEIRRSVENQFSSQHPPIFEQALKQLNSVAREKFSIV
jgi:BMFP domain-containing protein YqiC